MDTSSDLISKVILCLWFLSMTIKRSKMGNWAAHPAFPQLFIAPRTIFTQVCTVNSVLKISITNWLNENCSITFFFRDAKQIIWTIEYFLALFWIKLCCQRVWIRIFWHPLRAILACLGIILNSITYPSLPRILWLPKLLLSNIIFNYNCFKYPQALNLY